MHKILLKTAAIVFAGLMTTGGAFAYAPPNQIIRGDVRFAHLPPLAYQLFCLKNPNECRAGGSAALSFNAALKNKLISVNVAVNRSMRARPDGRVDTWTVGAASGDCEDFALTKRHQLVKMGLPAGALRMAVVRTSLGEGHAVLVVHTDRGDYVLDNLTSSVKLLDKTNLRLVSMASANPDRWNNG